MKLIRIYEANGYKIAGLQKDVCVLGRCRNGRIVPDTSVNAPELNLE